MSTRRFLVTGASQGIGAAVVEQARAAGHQVVFTGRDRARIDALAAKSGAHGIQANVTVAEDNARTVDEALKRMGGIDVLVNNAGYAYRADIGEWTSRRCARCSTPTCSAWWTLPTALYRR